MSLIQSPSRSAISSNIRDMLASGHSHAQSVAAALHTADRYGKHRAAGGSSGLPTNLPAGYGGPGAPANPNAPPGWSPGPPSALPIASPSQTTSMGAKAPTAPLYQVPTGPTQGMLSSGLMKVPQVGDYTMDLNTGALSPHTQQMLASYAMRGLPPAGGYPAAPAPAAPANATTNPNPDPALAPYIAALQNAGADPNSIAHFQAAQNTPYVANPTSGGGMKRGGRLASGGVPSSSEMAPWYARSEAHAMDHPSGLVHSFGPGRTDTVPLSVAAGSHVIPSDIVSGLGEGNSLAGAHAMSVAMKTGPGGISLPSGPHRPMAPSRIPRMTHMARGGDPQFEGHAIKIAKGNVPEHMGGVRCIVAGGEWVCKPDEVQRISYKGKHGHAALDQWILDRRAKDVKKIKSLPGPVRS